MKYWNVETWNLKAVVKATTKDEAIEKAIDEGFKKNEIEVREATKEDIDYINRNNGYLIE